MIVPFNKPVFLPEMETYLLESLKSNQLAGNGPLTKKSESELKALCGAPNLLTTSATHSLEMMALLLDIRPGDEVVLPSFTFVTSATSFALRGARLRFADNDDHGNILSSEVARLLTAKTKAVLTMHYAGASADMDPLLALCTQAG